MKRTLEISLPNEAIWLVEQSRWKCHDKHQNLAPKNQSDACHDNDVNAMGSSHRLFSQTTTTLVLLLLSLIKVSSSTAFASPLASKASRYQRYRAPFSSPSKPQAPRTIHIDTPSTTARHMSITLSSSTFYLSRIIFLRALALVYSVAFFVAYTQNQGLIGDHGITPARRVLDSAQRRGKHKRRERQEWLEQFHHALPRWKRLLYHDKVYQNVREKLWDRADRLGRPVTTVLWLCKDRSHLNPWLNNIALVGMTFSLYILFKGAANVPLLLTCWICQRSLMAVGGCWYGYGWEPQLAELGFHALFLVPFLSLSSTYSTPPPLLVIYSIRWYLFKIMMGAGLIKLKSGDWKWKDLSAMDSFYETQPVPNPLSKYFHLYSNHKLEVLVNHVVEVICPFLLLVPQTTRAGGLIQIAFQVLLILSGNLSFLNWLTMVSVVNHVRKGCCCLFGDALTLVSIRIHTHNAFVLLIKGTCISMFGWCVSESILFIRHTSIYICSYAQTSLSWSSRRHVCLCCAHCSTQYSSHSEFVGQTTTHECILWSTEISLYVRCIWEC